MNIINKSIRTLLIILCAAPLLVAPLLVAPLPAATQEQTAPALPAEAQQAFDRGLNAVQQQEWGLATRYFSEAQKTVPYAPTVLFNLGLAHAKAGHEVPAIAWLEAYLAVNPQVPNAEAIRAEIERLKTVTRGKMDTIYKAAIAAAQQLDPEDMYDVLTGISYSQASDGEIDAAIATNKLAHSRPPYSQEETTEVSNRIWRTFSYGLVSAGDLERAQEALKNVTEAESRDDVWEKIFRKWLESGDLETAKNAAQKIHDAEKKGKLLREVRIAVLEKIVNENAKKGDFDPVPLEELWPFMDYDLWKIRQLLSIAEQQERFKDDKGKARTVDRILKLARQEQKSSARASHLVYIAGKLVDMGDFSEAKTIAKEALECGQPLNEYSDEFYNKEKANIEVISYGSAVKAYAILGNVSEALALIRLMKPHPAFDLWAKDGGLGWLAYYQVMSGDIKGAKKTEAMAASIFDNPDKDDNGWVQTRWAQAQLKKGDPAGALETLKRSRVANHYFDDVCGMIFDALMAKGEVGKAMEAAKMVGEVARRKENVWDLEGAAKEYVREMGLIQIHAGAGDKAGKSEAAHVTANFSHAGDLIAMAIEVSADGRTGDLEKALKDVAEAQGWFAHAETAKDRIQSLSSVASAQQYFLDRISVLERKGGR